MRKSTDFPSWLRNDDTKRKLAGKEVLMYCTGGVRCERASALLKQELGNEVEGVFQLQGGIEKYMQAYPDGGYWTGKNFVFDKREAVDMNNVEGVGGVLSGKGSKKNGKRKNEKTMDDDVEILGRCCYCDTKWDRYIGKKKCRMCGVPVLLCQSCCTKRVDKIRSTESDMKLRCPLCVQQNVTVPAADVEFTDNGVHTKVPRNHCNSDGEDTKSQVASKTVCKWGGGHAKVKKRSRREDHAKKHFESVACKFGDKCTRSDCWFSHE